MLDLDASELSPRTSFQLAPWPCRPWQDIAPLAQATTFRRARQI